MKQSPKDFNLNNPECNSGQKDAMKQPEGLNINSTLNIPRKNQLHPQSITAYSHRSFHCR